MSNEETLVVRGADSDQNVYPLLQYARARFAGVHQARLGRIVGDDLRLEGRTLPLMSTMGASVGASVSLTLGEGVFFLQLLTGAGCGPRPPLRPGSSAYEVDLVDQGGTLHATRVRLFVEDLEPLPGGVLVYSDRQLIFAPEEVLARTPRDLDAIVRRILAEFDVLYGHATTLTPQVAGQRMLALLEAEDPSWAETFQLLERLRLMGRLDQLISLVPHTTGLGPYLRMKQVDWKYIYDNARLHIDDFGSFAAGIGFGVAEGNVDNLYDGLRVFLLLLYEGSAGIAKFTGLEALLAPGEKGEFHKQVDNELDQLYVAMKHFFANPLLALVEMASAIWTAFEEAMWNLEFFEAGRIFGNLLATLDMLFAGVTALPELVEAIANVPRLVRLTVSQVTRLGVTLAQLGEFMESFAPRGRMFVTADAGVRIWAIPNAGQVVVAHASAAGYLPMGAVIDALSKAGYAVGKGSRLPEPLTDPAESARDLGKKLFDELKKKGYKAQGRWRGIRPNPQKYPTVEIRPSGDIVGTHDELRKFLKNELGGTGRHSSLNVTLESHHLLEENFMAYFGITEGEGFAVALEASEHEKFTSLVPAELGTTRQDAAFFDIDEVYKASASAYVSAGHVEWPADMVEFLRANRDRLLKAYETGRVPGAKLPGYQARVARVTKFLLGL